MRTVSLNKTNCSYLINRTHLIVLSVVLRQQRGYLFLHTFSYFHSWDLQLSSVCVIHSNGIIGKYREIQFRALKFIYDDTDGTYEELLTKSKLPTLKIRRIRTIAIETFKIVNKTSPLYLHDLITIKQIKYSFRYQNTASIPSTRTTRYDIKLLNILLPKHGMSYQTTLDWKILLNNSKT